MVYLYPMSWGQNATFTYTYIHSWATSIINPFTLFTQVVYFLQEKKKKNGPIYAEEKLLLSMAHKTDLVPYPAKQIKFWRIHRASDSITSWHVPPPKQISVFAPFHHVKVETSFQHLIISYILVWHVPLAQVWTHYKIGKLNM